MADRFPGGQLHVELRGSDTSGWSVRPDDVIRQILKSSGVERTPQTADARLALYRTLLTDRRVLVILDDAGDAEQVRPLLPPSGGCLAVVTSRRPLTGIVAPEGARSLTLDVFAAEQSRELLVRHLGASRLEAEPDATGELIDVSGGLPLALGVVFRRRRRGRPTAPA